jgi:cysteine dioxygenase
MNLEQFFDRLDALGQNVALCDLKGLLADLHIEESDLAELMCFDPGHYMRNRILRTDSYEVLVLCFAAGQRTPIHDHAGSACGVKVLEGTASETIFQRTEDGWLFPTETRQLLPGGVVGSFDSDTHQLSNLQSGGQRLVTLHVYSPPLREVGNYSLTSNEVVLVRAPTHEPLSVP